VVDGEQGGDEPVGVGATSVLVQADGVANAGLGEGGRKGDLVGGFSQCQFHFLIEFLCLSEDIPTQ
jgi:hypothetical protein